MVLGPGSITRAMTADPSLMASTDAGTEAAAIAPSEGAAAPPVAAPAHPTPPTYQQIEAFGYQRFTNREQSRLDFGARLLDLAEDDSLPLLERVKFVAIFSELLDEFFPIRVGG